MRFEDSTLLDFWKNTIETADGAKGSTKLMGSTQTKMQLVITTLLIVTYVRRVLEVQQTFILQYCYDH